MIEVPYLPFPGDPDFEQKLNTALNLARNATPGAQGNPGAIGATGATGATGAAGLIDLTTLTTQTGYLKGNGATVSAVVKVEDEVLTGIINGVNTNFSTAFDFIPGSIRVYRNGNRNYPGATSDYMESGTNLIIYSFAPVAGDLLTADYLKA